MNATLLSAALLTAAITGCAATATPTLTAQAATPAAAAEPGREVLAPGDGWASHGSGTTGGSAATPDQVYTVTNRQELVSALQNASATPKIIFVHGLIDANVDDHGRPLSCHDYAAPAYSLQAYLDAYDPAVWGWEREPEGPLEDARAASQKNQAARVRIKVGSNTTIVGVGKNSGFTGANLMLDKVENVILRNLNFLDAHDCFPAWDPTDGSQGNWNSEYDTVSLTTARNIWVDHSAFSDGDNPDSAQPLYFGRPYQVHDGLLDITRGSDLVTVSWNTFNNHDKTMLIGSTNNPKPGPTDDRGKLRVTVHHNLFDGNIQRLPRVRFGQVHVYNNLYDLRDTPDFDYAWGVGKESSIYAQNNYFQGDVPPAKFIRDWGGTAIHVSGTYLNGSSAHHRLDLLAAYNTESDRDLGSDVGWTPTLHGVIHPTQAVPALLNAQAGPR